MTRASPGTDRTQAAARLAIGGYFFINGVIFASWVSRIPDIMHRLRLDERQLGAALFVAAVGTVIGLLWMERRLDRYGSHRVVVLAALLVALGLIGPGLAGSLPWLMVALLVFGLASGVLNVAMNAQAVALDRVAGRPIISYFHAAYSAGGLIGAGLGALAVAARISPSVAFAALGVGAAAASLLAARWVVPERPLPPDVGVEAEHAGAGVEAERSGIGAADQPPPRLGARITLLGLCWFACLMAEGVIADWAGVFLRDDLQASPHFAPAGFFFFSVAMVTARLTGSRLVARFGPERVVQTSSLLAAAGLVLFVLAPNWIVGVLGLCVFGLGLACIGPQLFRWAGEGASRWTGRAVARVSVFGYVGLLGGPPIIGVLAHWIGLRTALAVLIALMLAVAVLSLRVTAPRAVTTVRA